MNRYKNNIDLLKNNNVYSKEMEHDACGVGLVASTEGRKSREVVEYGIQAKKLFGTGEPLTLMVKQVMAQEFTYKYQRIFL